MLRAVDWVKRRPFVTERLVARTRDLEMRCVVGHRVALEIQAGCRAVRSLLASPGRPTALLLTNDLVAIGAL